MASAKDLRDKPLSEMSADELKKYISDADNAGWTSSDSKDVGKAVDLLKVMDTTGQYGDETVASAKEKLQSSTTPETQQKLGIAPPPPAGEGGASSFASFTGQPEIDLNKIYDDALGSEDIVALETELEERKRARDEAEGDINDNPWYSEATRVGKIAKLEERAGDDIRTLESTLAQKRADAQVRVNIALQQYNIESQAYQNNLNRLNLLISSGALLNASGDDIAQIALATGMSTEMINGIMNKMRTDQVSPQVITRDDNAGNVTVTVIDGKTGEIISQQSLGAIGKSSGTTSGFKPGTETYTTAVNLLTQDLASVVGDDGYVHPTDYRTFRSQWVSAGFNPDDFDKSFKGFIDPSHPQDYIVGYSDPDKYGFFTP